MTSAPQKIAIRRLVRGADGQMSSILVDAYSYVPVTDATGYKVVDVSDVPEQVQDVTQPDAAKPVKAKVDKTTTGSIRGGSEFGNSSRGGQNTKFGNVPSSAAPSRSRVNQSFPSAPSAPVGTQTAPSPSTPPSVGSNMPATGASTDTTVPQGPTSAPGYSQPSQASSTPSTPSAPSQAPSPNTPAPSSGLAAGLPSGTSVSVNNGVTSTTSTQAGVGSGGTATGTASFGTGPTSTGGYTSQSGNPNGRGFDNNYSPDQGPALGMSSPSAFGSMYGDGVGYGGGYVADGSQSVAKDTIDSARTTQNVSERSQAMGAVPDSATSPAAAAARGLTNRTPSQLDKIGLTIAGEVTPQTLADLTSPDPAAQAAAKAQVANIQATMENRAATAPWGTIENALTPAQYNSLTPGKQLNTSTANYAKYNAALTATVKDFYTGLNPPTNYNFTNYANTNPIPGVYSPPGWLNAIQDPTQVGPFTFGTDPAYSNPGRYTPEAQANYAAAQADYGAAGAYKQSPDYGTDPGWGSFQDPANPNNGYSFGYGYGQSAVDPGWGGFAGGTTNTGGYSSDSGNGNGRGSGIAGGGGSSYGGYGGNSSTGGGSGYGGGNAGNGTGSGGSAGMSGGGGYSPGGMGSPSGSSNDGGGDASNAGGGNENGDAGGGGAGTRGNGAGSWGGL